MIRIHAISCPVALVGCAALLVLAGSCQDRGRGALEIRPDSLVFDALAVGRVSDARVVEWSNPGADSVAVAEVLVSGAGERDFVVAEDLCEGVSLAPGESCSVAILFAPREAGVSGATLSAVSRPETAANVALVGDGVAAAADIETTGLVHAVPETLDFSLQPVGAVGGPLGIRLVNQRAGPVQFAVRLQGGQAADYRIALDRCSNEILDSGRACTIQVLFEPRGEGLRAGELILRDLNGARSQSVPLMGTGVVDAWEARSASLRLSSRSRCRRPRDRWNSGSRTRDPRAPFGRYGSRTKGPRTSSSLRSRLAGTTRVLFESRRTIAALVRSCLPARAHWASSSPPRVPAPAARASRRSLRRAVSRRWSFSAAPAWRDERVVAVLIVKRP